MSIKTVNRWREFTEKMRGLADYRAIYAGFGCESTGSVSPDGWIRCKSHPNFGGDDRSPSASLNVNTGWIKDFRHGGKAMSLWDFMVLIGKATDWRDAQLNIAIHLGVKIPRIGKHHPEYGVKWVDWNDILAKQYCEKKPPITTAGLKLSGAMMCTRFDVLCFAWPIYNQYAEVVGFCFTSRNGMPFSNGAKSIVKKHADSEAGLLGTPAAIHLAHQMDKKKLDTDEASDEDYYWVEGLPDMVAAYSIFPEVKCVTNPSGCLENVTPAQAAMMNSGNVRARIVADADVPGVVGATKRRNSLLELNEIQCVTAMVPSGFKIKEKHGQDLRDALNNSCKDEAVLCIGDLCRTISGDQEEQKILEKVAENDRKAADALMARAKSTLKDLGIHVLSSFESNIRIFCEETNNMVTFRKIGQVQYEDLIQAAGSRIIVKVSKTQKESNGDRINFQTVMNFIALAASEIGEPVNRQGAGIWGVRDEDGDQTGGLRLVQRHQCFTVNGGCLEQHQIPVFREQNVAADISCREKWFDPELLRECLEDAGNVEWRQQVHKDLLSYISSWKWEHKGMDTLACGLIYATWYQSLWPLRPVVVVAGESDSGKTKLFETMRNLYMGLAYHVTDFSPSGITQNIGTGMVIYLLDEVDNNPFAKDILGKLRASSRGGLSLRGTTDQDGRQFRMRHLMWLGGITVDSDHEADSNRIVNLRMLPTKYASLRMPSLRKSRELGHKILASVLVTAGRAVEIAKQVSYTQVPGKISPRYRETYAVPFSALGAMIDNTVEDTKVLLDGYLSLVVEEQVISEGLHRSAQESLLALIMESSVYLGPVAPKTHATVAEILFDDQFTPYTSHLGNYGISYVKIRSGKPVIAFHGKTIASRGGLLKHDDRWCESHGINNTLILLGDRFSAGRRIAKVGGTSRKCITLDYVSCLEWVSQEQKETLF